MSSYSDNVDAVKLLALSLPNECSEGSYTCPACGKSGSFNVTRADNELKFICFRVSCKFHGKTGDRTDDTNQRVTVRKAKLFDGQLDFLNDFETRWLANEFLIEERWLHPVRWGIRDSRVYYPQYNADGRLGGYIARYYPELNYNKQLGDDPKAYWKPTLDRDCGLMYPNPKVMANARKQGRLVMVEDYPSALRINSQLGIPTCCMGGTNLYNSMINTLIKAKVATVRVVLDNDACDKAVKMAHEIGFCIPDTEVIPLLNCDVKDMSLAECASTFKDMI
jgi:hypothetical protein